MSGASVTPGELPSGADFGGFRIEGVLGRGAMGVVYRATDIRLQRSVALKVVAAHLAEDESFRERFVAEARAAAMVEHPGIVAVYASGEEDGVPYIAMRLIEGRELSEILAASGRLAPQEALRLLAPIASALDAASRAGIVHRDVKPSNILVPADGSGAVLVDFGIGRIKGSSRATQSGSWLGTADYVAPEQIQTGDVDGRADQYSLACVFYELLTGNPPFHRDDTIQTLWAHVNTPPASVAQVMGGDADAIDVVLSRALAKDPADRFETAFEFIDAASVAFGLATGSVGASPAKSSKRGTGTVIGGTPPLSLGPKGTVIAESPATLKAPQRGTSRRVLAIGGAAVVVLVLVVGAFALSRGGGGEEAGTTLGAVASEDMATGTQTTTTADQEETAVDVEAATKDFNQVIRKTAEWRARSKRPNENFYAQLKQCNGLVGSALASCMQPVASRRIYNQITGWFNPLRQDLEGAYLAGEGDSDFVAKNRACYEDARQAIQFGIRRASLADDYYTAYGRGDRTAGEVAEKAIQGEAVDFDRAWKAFIAACDQPKRFE